MHIPPEVLEIKHLSIFVAFAVGATQLLKPAWEASRWADAVTRLFAACALVGSAGLYRFVPADWQAFYLLFLLAVAVPGVVGLTMQIRRDF